MEPSGLRELRRYEDIRKWNLWSHSLLDREAGGGRVLLMIELTKCPICASSSYRHAYLSPTTRRHDRNDHNVWCVSECCDCGHQFMNPQPTWDELAPYYHDRYAPYELSADQDEQQIRMAKQTGRLRHVLIPKGKRLLDLGCGAGNFLRVAKRLGAIEQGVEPSTYASRVCRDQGLNVFTGTLEQFAQQTADKFEIITASHVVEHLHDPVGTLRTMKSLLAPGGLIWIGVPNAAYPINRALKGLHPIADLPLHLMQFTPRSLISAGGHAGLKLRKQVTESLPHFVEDSIGYYFRHKMMVPRRWTSKLRVFRPLAGWYAGRTERQNNGETILAEFVDD
jgi:2-polyprenyl-3-methyl-5-hydroxy-6-metoxy-1,4-benzoquinol methylase